MPFQSMKNKIKEFVRNDEGQVLFLHIREPEEIKRVVDEFEAKTILVVRDSVIKITSNVSDKNVFDYHYDVVIENNGTVEDLKERVKQFVNEVVMIERE